jgi:hypothetical protein
MGGALISRGRRSAEGLSSGEDTARGGQRWGGRTSAGTAGSMACACASEQSDKQTIFAPSSRAVASSSELAILITYEGREEGEF